MHIFWLVWPVNFFVDCLIPFFDPLVLPDTILGVFRAVSCSRIWRQQHPRLELTAILSAIPTSMTCNCHRRELQMLWHIVDVYTLKKPSLLVTIGVAVGDNPGSGTNLVACGLRAGFSTVFRYWLDSGDFFRTVGPFGCVPSLPSWMRLLVWQLEPPECRQWWSWLIIYEWYSNHIDSYVKTCIFGFCISNGLFDAGRSLTMSSTEAAVSARRQWCCYLSWMTYGAWI